MMPEPTLRDIAGKMDAARQEMALVKTEVTTLTEIVARLEALTIRQEKVIAEIRGILPREFVRMGATYRVR